MSDEEVYKVGRGRPPLHSRFRPGRSGNPSGKKKGARSLRTDLAEELAQVVQIRENGQAVSLTKQQLVIKALMTNALRNPRAAATLLDLVSKAIGYGEDDRPAVDRLDDDDEALIAAFLARQDKEAGHG